MQDHQTHAFEHTLLNAIHQAIVNLIVGCVSPPKQYVRRIEPLFGQPLVGLIQRRSRNVEDFRQKLIEPISDGLVNAVRINLRDFGLILFVNEFVPNRNVNGHRDLFQGSRISGSIVIHFEAYDTRFVESGLRIL